MASRKDWLLKMVTGKRETPSSSDNWEELCCFTEGRHFSFKFNSRQCNDIVDYLDIIANFGKSARESFQKDERIRGRCEQAVKEFRRAIIEAKFFLEDCSVVDFLKNANSLIKLETGEAYDVHLHNLIWSKTGLDLAILYAKVEDPTSNAQERRVEEEIIKRRVEECRSVLLDRTVHQEARLSGDRYDFYQFVEKPDARPSQEKCYKFFMQKSKAYKQQSQATENRAKNFNMFEIDPRDLLDSEKNSFLGRGSYGEVYKKSWLGHKVAVKEFSEMNEGLFRSEAGVLAGLHNPFIVHMIGWCKKDSFSHEKKSKKKTLVSMLVMELTETDLKTLIEQQALSLHAAVDIMLQISKGMEYLHKNKIIHRDIKPSNVLLEPTSIKQIRKEGYARVKLCDFGLAKVKQRISADTTSEFSTKNVGTSYFRAPEVLEVDDSKSKYTRKADVFSFAITCSEILERGSAKNCFGELSRKAMLQRMLANVRPNLPKDCPSHLEDLIRICWDTDPRRRPAFSRISNTLIYIKFILMRVSDVKRGLYDSVVSRFDEDELERRISKDEELEAGGGKSRRGEKDRINDTLDREDDWESSNILDEEKVESVGSGSWLKSGEFLETHESIECNGYKFVMQGDGNLVLYEAGKAGRAVWASQTEGGEGRSCMLKDDGNLVMYKGKGREESDVVWASNSKNEKATYKLELESGRAVIRAVNSKLPIWATDESVERPSLRSGQFLVAHQWLLSNGYKLLLQGDGNLVLIFASNQRVLWASQKLGGTGCTCMLTDDGNLVIYDNRGRANVNHVVWSSNSSSRRANYKLELESGRAVIRGPMGNLVWATDKILDRPNYGEWPIYGGPSVDAMHGLQIDHAR